MQRCSRIGVANHKTLDRRNAEMKRTAKRFATKAPVSEILVSRVPTRKYAQVLLAMVLRCATAAFLEAEKFSRRIQGHRDLWVLPVALDRE